mmetsp:Transcript_161111/g.517104  ORF Transcript_161111/g.517104 Transcript_161111/m.517104 type:complete len:176 (+) Transcript_161111:52-579(+)
MDRQERVLVHRSLGCLVRSLRQWEAADAVASRELEKCVNGLARAEYLAPEHAGLLGFAGLNAESLALARAASYAQGSPLMHRVMELLEVEVRSGDSDCRARWMPREKAWRLRGPIWGRVPSFLSPVTLNSGPRLLFVGRCEWPSKRSGLRSHCDAPFWPPFQKFDHLIRMSCADC